MGGLFHCRGPATAGRAVSTRRPEKSREGSTAGWEGDTAGEGGGFGGKGPGAAAEGGCDAAAERPRGWSRGDMEGRTDCRAGEGDPGCPGGVPRRGVWGVPSPGQPPRRRRPYLRSGTLRARHFRPTPPTAGARCACAFAWQRCGEVGRCNGAWL